MATTGTPTNIASTPVTSSVTTSTPSPMPSLHAAGAMQTFATWLALPAVDAASSSVFRSMTSLLRPCRQMQTKHTQTALTHTATALLAILSHNCWFADILAYQRRISFSPNNTHTRFCACFHTHTHTYIHEKHTLLPHDEMHPLAVVAIAMIVMTCAVVVTEFMVVMSGVTAHERVLWPRRFDLTRGAQTPLVPYRVIICTLARNAGSSLARCAKRLELLGETWLEYKILVFENDSTDNTRAGLLEWQEANPCVRIIECGFLAPHCKFNHERGYQLEMTGKARQRMLQMAVYRNMYLEDVEKEDPRFTHVIVADFDGEGYIDRDGMREVMQRADDFDGVACNGQMHLPPFFCTGVTYDALAFLSADTPLGKQLRMTEAQRFAAHTNYTRCKIPRGAKLVPVLSSFNGLAIYNRNSIRGLRYESLQDDVLGCEHCGLHVAMARAGHGRFFLAPDFTVQMGQQGNPVKWTYFASWLKNAFGLTK